MNEFKVGDRVVYKGTDRIRTPNLEGLCGTVVGFSDTGHSVRADWDDSPAKFGVLAGNLRHVTPAPDPITIDRADLPEVMERDGKFWAGSGPEECMARGSENPNWLRNHANAALALAEFLEARDKAAEEADLRLCQRRDELAEELTSEQILYSDCGAAITTAIDRIIELEDARG